MERRRRKKRTADVVEINLAAMLDMAFQLLMFFILTFSPMPLESQIAAQLPASGTIMPRMMPQPSDAGVVTITVLASEAGLIKDLAVNEAIVPNLQGLALQLHRAIGGRQPSSLVLQIDTKLHYQELVNVVDTCLQVGGPADQTIGKMTFVELRQNR